MARSYRIWIPDASIIPSRAELLGESEEELRRLYEESVAKGEVLVLTRSLTDEQVQRIKEMPSIPLRFWHQDRPKGSE